jgi:hypothetical protein
VPVLLVLFARPDTVRPVFERIRAARPRTLLVATDAPRPDHPGETDACRAARDVVQVDWPCEVLRHDAPENLGCDTRLNTALDWTFAQVDRAIILEDDVVPEPDFFGFAARMLERYEHDPTFMHVAGRNELGRWPVPASGVPVSAPDHLTVVRGSVWGWATWARAWQRRTTALERIDDSVAEPTLVHLAGDPIVAEHLSLQLSAARNGTLSAWDVTWSLARALSGGVCVAPPVNLVRNVGFGPTATRTTHAGDLRGGLPSMPLGDRPARAFADSPPPRPGCDQPPIDRHLDRWTVLMDLMSTYLDPTGARRLARASELLWRHRADGRTVRHHLAPFAMPNESLDVLEHVRSAGSSSAMLDAIERELHMARDEQVARG